MDSVWTALGGQVLDLPGALPHSHTYNGMEMEWNGMEWNGMEWNEWTDDELRFGRKRQTTKRLAAENAMRTARGRLPTPLTTSLMARDEFELAQIINWLCWVDVVQPITAKNRHKAAPGVLAQKRLITRIGIVARRRMARTYRSASTAAGYAAWITALPGPTATETLCPPSTSSRRDLFNVLFYESNIRDNEDCGFDPGWLIFC